MSLAPLFLPALFQFLQFGILLRCQNGFQLGLGFLADRLEFFSILFEECVNSGFLVVSQGQLFVQPFYFLRPVLFMIMFGLGTLPAMLAMSYFGTSLSLGVRQAMRKAVPYGIALMAVVLVLRGMNLGIPFISPVLQSAPGAAIDCHE